MAVTNTQQHAASMTDTQRSAAATISDTVKAGRTLGSFTFDEIGTLTSDQIGLLTFDTVFNNMTDQQKHNV